MEVATTYTTDPQVIYSTQVVVEAPQVTHVSTPIDEDISRSVPAVPADSAASHMMNPSAPGGMEAVPTYTAPQMVYSSEPGAGAAAPTHAAAPVMAYAAAPKATHSSEPGHVVSVPTHTASPIMTGPSLHSSAPGAVEAEPTYAAGPQMAHSAPGAVAAVPTHTGKQMVYSSEPGVGVTAPTHAAAPIMAYAAAPQATSTHSSEPGHVASVPIHTASPINTGLSLQSSAPGAVEAEPTYAAAPQMAYLAPGAVAAVPTYTAPQMVYSSEPGAGVTAPTHAAAPHMAYAAAPRAAHSPEPGFVASVPTHTASPFMTNLSLPWDEYIKAVCKADGQDEPEDRVLKAVVNKFTSVGFRTPKSALHVRIEDFKLEESMVPPAKSLIRQLCSEFRVRVAAKEKAAKDRVTSGLQGGPMGPSDFGAAHAVATAVPAAAPAVTYAAPPMTYAAAPQTYAAPPMTYAAAPQTYAAPTAPWQHSQAYHTQAGIEQWFPMQMDNAPIYTGAPPVPQHVLTSFDPTYTAVPQAVYASAPGMVEALPAYSAAPQMVYPSMYTEAPQVVPVRQRSCSPARRQVSSVQQYTSEVLAETAAPFHNAAAPMQPPLATPEQTVPLDQDFGRS